MDVKLEDVKAMYNTMGNIGKAMIIDNTVYNSAKIIKIGKEYDNREGVESYYIAVVWRDDTNNCNQIDYYYASEEQVDIWMGMAQTETGDA